MSIVCYLIFNQSKVLQYNPSLEASSMHFDETELRAFFTLPFPLTLRKRGIE